MQQRYNGVEIAQLLGVAPSTVYREIREGRLAAIRVGARYIVLHSELARYVGGEGNLRELLAGRQPHRCDSHLASR